MLADLQKRSTQAVEIAQDAGAEEAWASMSRNRDVQFEYRDGALEKVKDTTSQSMSVAIYAEWQVLKPSYDRSRTGAPAEFRRRSGCDYACALEPDDFRADHAVRVVRESLEREPGTRGCDRVDTGSRSALGMVQSAR